MGATIPHWDPESLSGTHDNISSQLAWGLQHRERQQVTRHYNLNTVGVGVLNKLGIVQDLALRSGVLDKDTADIPRTVVNVLEVRSDYLKVEPTCPGLADVNGLWMAVVCDDECLFLPLEDVVAHSHGLCSSRPFIEEGRVGHGQACEVRDHGLEIQQTLQSSLRDLRLIGGVLSVPSRVLHDVSQDHRGHESIVIAHPDEGLVDLVHRGQSIHVLQHLSLGEPSIELGELHGVNSDRFRDGGVDKGVKALEPAGFRHPGLLLRGGRVVAAGEGVVRLQGLHGDGSGLL